MEMSVVPIRVESDYSYRQYRDFFIFNFFRGKYYQLNMLVDFAGMPVLYAIIKVFLFFRTATFTFGLFDMLYLAFYLLLILYVLLAPRSYYNQSRATAESSIFVDFAEDAFSVTFDGPLSSGENVYHYAGIHRVYELPDMFYLYVTTSQAYLLNKARLHQEEISDLHALFAEKVGPAHFIQCRVFGNAHALIR